MMQYLTISENDTVEVIVWKVVWNIREDVRDYDYEPSREEILYLIKNNKTAYKKVISWERKNKLMKITNESNL